MFAQRGFFKFLKLIPSTILFLVWTSTFGSALCQSSLCRDHSKLPHNSTVFLISFSLPIQVKSDPSLPLSHIMAIIKLDSANSALPPVVGFLKGKTTLSASFGFSLDASSVILSSKPSSPGHHPPCFPSPNPKSRPIFVTSCQNCNLSSIIAPFQRCLLLFQSPFAVQNDQ